MISQEQIKRICFGIPDERAAKIIQPLNDAMDEFEINTPLRIAAFVAQLAHESGSFRYVEEIASGQAYEGRKDLGNTEPGDGKRFKGRGWIQITGRDNYQKCGDYLGVDLISCPEKLAEVKFAGRGSGWFWMVRNLNPLADEKEFMKISIRINGRNKLGVPNGWKERKELYARALEIIA